MINRLKIIVNLLLGKHIVIYNIWTKEVLMIIGGENEIITKRYNYEFIGNEVCLKGKRGKKILFDEEVK